MYICTECGRIMENPSSWTEPHGEDMCGCSYCGGAVEEAVECKICGEYHLEDYLMNGICKKCLTDSINCQSAFRYLKETKRFRDFFLVWSWGIAERVNDDKECPEIDRTLMAIFRLNEAENPKLFENELRKYILDDIYEWSEFLAKEEE